MQVFEITAKHKYGQVFMSRECNCENCNEVTFHWFSIVATNKAMNNAKRIKQCEKCNVTSLAPIEEGI